MSPWLVSPQTLTGTAGMVSCRVVGVCNKRCRSSSCPDGKGRANFNRQRTVPFFDWVSLELRDVPGQASETQSKCFLPLVFERTSHTGHAACSSCIPRLNFDSVWLASNSEPAPHQRPSTMRSSQSILCIFISENLLLRVDCPESCPCKVPSPRPQVHNGGDPECSGTHLAHARAISVTLADMPCR